MAVGKRAVYFYHMIKMKPMKKVFFVLMLIVVVPASAQFSYKAWNVGIQTGSLKIQNGMSRYAVNNPNGQVGMVDSANSAFHITNVRFNIDAINSHVYVKGGVTLPVTKPVERDTETVVGKHMEVDMKFAYGFTIKEKVSFQFGLNLGIFNITQEENLKIARPFSRVDYFVPSAGSSGAVGQKYFGGMAAWQAGFLVNNLIMFSDQLALRTTYSHNNLRNKRKTIDGRNDQLEFGLHYSNENWHNFGFSVNFVQNWMHFKGYEEGPKDANSTGREYPATKARMTTVYIGLNFPIVFGD
jgi:hypothetical protein